MNTNNWVLPADDAPMIEWALCYARNGIAVFPIQTRTKTGYFRYDQYLGKPSKKYPNGTPFSWQAQASTDLDRVKKFWTDHPDANIGGLTGRPSGGLCSLDFDVEHIATDKKTGKEYIVRDGKERLREWEQETGLKINEDTMTSTTGSGGQQYFYIADFEKMPHGGAGDSHIFEYDAGNDTRGEGNYCVLPPSIHPNGKRYEWDLAPDDYPPAAADEAFYRYWRGGKKTPDGSGGAPAFDELKNVTGGRHDALKSYMAGVIAKTKGGLAPAEYEAILKLANDSLPVPVGQGADDDSDEYEKTVVPMVQNLLTKEKEKEGDGVDYRAAMREWRRANPGKEFDGDWEPVREAWRAAGCPAFETEEKTDTETLEALKTKDILTEEEAITLSTSKPLPLKTTQKGTVSAEFCNFTEIVENDAYLQGKIKFDLMQNKVTVEGFFWDLDRHQIKNKDYYELRRYISKLYGIGNKNDCQMAVALVAQNHSYHPVRQFFDSLEWDGVSRIPDLFPKFLGAERCRYTEVFTELVFASIIERIYHPGTKQDICYILADQMQGSGKSAMCRYLALRDEYYTDELKSFKDQAKAFEKIQGRMICEFSEMLSIKRAQDVETVKAYLSQLSDDYRAPYSICSERYLRQCTFLATSNKPEFLPEDKTGNRRFMPLLCDGTKAELHPVAHEKEARHFVIDCFAEMLYRRRQQGRLPLVIPPDMIEAVKRVQELSAPEDPRIGQIQRWLDLVYKDNVVCSKIIFKYALLDPRAPLREPTRYELTDIADIMNLRIDGWVKYRGKNGDSRYSFPLYGQQRAWQRVDSNRQTLSNRETDPVYELEKALEFTRVPDDMDTPFD